MLEKRELFGKFLSYITIHQRIKLLFRFARIRIMLRFELMCLDLEEMEVSDMSFEKPKECFQSVGLKKMEQLSREGGVYEDSKNVKKSVGTPDFMSYLENIAF